MWGAIASGAMGASMPGLGGLGRLTKNLMGSEGMLDAAEYGDLSSIGDSTKKFMEGVEENRKKQEPFAPYRGAQFDAFSQMRGMF